LLTWFTAVSGLANCPLSLLLLVILKSCASAFFGSFCGVSIFLDMPIGAKEKKMAVTAYSVYYNYNFGPNYLRNIGIMNEGIADATFTGAKALAGPGNAQPMIGTGSIWYTQAGFLIPNKNEKPKVRIQPYLAYTNKNFDALKKSSNQFDLGTNLFLDGHHAKLTAQYSNRPVYTTVDHIDGYKGEFLLQLQVYL
jgi:hypothetical protein